MSDIFLGQLMLVPYNFPPKGFAFCAGQILAISQNTALFSLLGTFYGGNGSTNYALPDLRGRVPIGMGQGPGLQDYVLGEQSGSETVTLLQTEIPSHQHNLMADGGPGSTSSPVNDAPARLVGGTGPYAAAAAPLNQAMNSTMLAPAGGNQPHNNLMPYLALNWIICLQGIFPARN